MPTPHSNKKFGRTDVGIQEMVGWCSILPSKVAGRVAIAKAHQAWGEATMVQVAKADTVAAENAAGRTVAAAEAEEDLDTIPTESLERSAATAPVDAGSVRNCLLPLAEEPMA
jgi:hypothetical protein